MVFPSVRLSPPDKYGFQINGKPYHLAEPADLDGGKSWTSEIIPSQPGDPAPEHVIALNDFSGGALHEWGDARNGYEAANGFEARNPLEVKTWPPLTSQTIHSLTATGSGRIWIAGVRQGNDLMVYIAAGHYVTKYNVRATIAALTLIEYHDLAVSDAGATRVCGRMAVFKGKLYVPIASGFTGFQFDPTLARFHEMGTGATAVTEEQTITISGTPTSGTYTISFDGKTTSALVYNASGAAVQAALRLLRGLQDVTVATTGSTPNFTHTVTMTAAPSAMGTASPVQMTSTPDGSFTGSGGSIAHATTIAGTGDTWNRGPATKESRCFITQGTKLIRGYSNKIESVEADPLTAVDWGGETEAGDTTGLVTDLATYKPVLLVVGKHDGWGTFDAQLAWQWAKQLPIDPVNCIGMVENDGYVYIPTVEGLDKWRPGAYETISPEQEGITRSSGNDYQDAHVIDAIIPYGKDIYVLDHQWNAGLGLGGTYDLRMSSFDPTKQTGGRWHIHQGFALTNTASYPLAGGGVLQTAGEDPIMLLAMQTATTPWTVTMQRFRLHHRGQAYAPWAIADGSGIGTPPSAKFTMSRRSDPDPSIQKTYRAFEVEASLNYYEVGVHSQGFEVWASIEDADFIQLLNSAGAAQTATSGGSLIFYFPATAAAVGKYCQLEARAPTGSGDDRKIAFRGGKLYAEVDTKTTERIEAVIVINPGLYEDGSVDRDEEEQQVAVLKALAGTPSAIATYTDPTNGATGRCKVKVNRVKVITEKPGAQRFLVYMTLRAAFYG